MSGQKSIYNTEYLDDDVDGDDKRKSCRDFGCK